MGGESNSLAGRFGIAVFIQCNPRLSLGLSLRKSVTFNQSLRLCVLKFLHLQNAEVLLHLGTAGSHAGVSVIVCVGQSYLRIRTVRKCA